MEITSKILNERASLLQKLLPARRKDTSQISELSTLWRKQIRLIRYSESRQRTRFSALVTAPRALGSTTVSPKFRKKFVRPVLLQKKAHDNPLRIMSPSAQLDTTRGGGQHLRKSLATTVTKNLHQINNLQFFYKLSPFIPSLHPFRRLVGVYTRKGNTSSGMRLAENTYAKFKKGIPSSVSMLPLGQLLFLKRVDAIKNPFTLRSFKVAANKVKVPYLSSYPRSFTAVFALLREQSSHKEAVYRKHFAQAHLGVRTSNGVGKAMYAAELLLATKEDALFKKREELMSEANLNKSNLRYKNS